MTYTSDTSDTTLNPRVYKGASNEMKLPVFADGTGHELIYPGAVLSRKQAQRYGEKHMPRDLKRVGFKAYVFEADPQLHGARYFRITYGKEC